MWKINPYTISYNANGGSGAPAPQIKTHDVSLTLSSAKPTYTGHTFLGWSESSTATVATYSAGDVYTANADATLYAVWQPVPDSERINFVIDLVEVTENTLHIYGWAYDKTADTSQLTIEIHHQNAAGADVRTYLTHSHRTDVNEVFHIDGLHGIDYTEAIALTGTYTLTVYAIPVDSETRLAIYSGQVEYNRTFTVAYDNNGGDGVPAQQTKSYNVDLTLSDEHPTKPGYVFQGWSTEKNGEAAYQPGDVYSGNKSITLYAVWQPLADDMRINAFIDSAEVNGNTLRIYGWAYDTTSPSSPLMIEIHHQSAEEDWVQTYVTDSHRIDVNEAYGISGLHGIDFSVSENLAGTYTLTVCAIPVNSETRIPVYTGQVEYTRTYTITYQANNGEGAPDPQIVLHGQSVMLSAVTPIRFRHRFLGWAYSPTATVAAYQPRDVWALQRDATLYAVWEERETDLRLPAGLKTIEEEAFAQGGFESVVVPDSCQTIQSKAFADCARLQSIYLPASVNFIATDAFEGSTGVVIYAPNTAESVIAFAQLHSIRLSIVDE